MSTCCPPSLWHLARPPTVSTLAMAALLPATFGHSMLVQRIAPCVAFPVLDAKHAAPVGSGGLGWPWMHNPRLYLSKAMLLDSTVLRVFFGVCSWLALSKSNHMVRIVWAAWSYLHFVLKGAHSSRRCQLCKNAEMKECLLMCVLFGGVSCTIWIQLGVFMPAPAPQLFVCVCVIEKIDESVGVFARSLSWQWGPVAEECWLREGSKSQLLRVSDIGVIVCAKRPGGVIFVALTVMALSLFLLPRWASWVRQVHPGEWKQASWLCFCLPLLLINSQAHKSWFDHFKNQNNLRLFTLTRSECMTPLLACLYACLKFAYWSRSAAHMCCAAFQTSIHPDRRNAADMNAWYLHMVSVHCQQQTFKSTVRWINPEPGCL